MDEEDQLRFGFDLLDPTKIVPEELVPVTPLGKLVLNRNPRNYFAETEQVMVSITALLCLILLIGCGPPVSARLVILLSCAT
jgi:catalase